MSAHKPYTNLRDAQLNDATVNQMMHHGCQLTEIIVRLANEKAELLIKLMQAEAYARPSMLTLHSDGRITPCTPPLHIPNIPPNTPQ